MGGADVRAFFRAFTPVDELALLEIASRPARRPDGIDYLGSLRAIPWVFSWTQTRVMLPAWFGAGTAFAELEPSQLRDLYERLPFVRTIATTWRCRSRSRAWRSRAATFASSDDASLFDVIAASTRESRRRYSRRPVSSLLERHPMIRRSVDLRNPYVDPMNALQIELLRRHRAGDETAQLPLLRSIAGIAAALRNTG